MILWNRSGLSQPSLASSTVQPSSAKRRAARLGELGHLGVDGGEAEVGAPAHALAA